MPSLGTEISMSGGSINILLLKVCIKGIGDQSKYNDFVMGAYTTSIQSVNSVSGKEKLYIF